MVLEVRFGESEDSSLDSLVPGHGSPEIAVVKGASWRNPFPLSTFNSMFRSSGMRRRYRPER
jgi:hypothetical protein